MFRTPEPGRNEVLAFIMLAPDAIQAPKSQDDLCLVSVLGWQVQRIQHMLLCDPTGRRGSA
jgi:hypothetical protein